MIPVFQREIVEVPFLLPDGTFKHHPALVVSVPELQEEEEGLFYAVLISTKNHHPKYTIEIKAEDIVNRPSIDKTSYFVTHIVTYFLTRDIIQRKGYFVTKSKFNEVVDTVINNIFGEPLNEK
ncbi:MAG: type II toxin-antitoxin system PemK/MazF family toxin [Muribaculaceae bacterium]|nr:type II toxin-antitoxin system PemK/MazF family toxin [Muribaculaceae bacterium]